MRARLAVVLAFVFFAGIAFVSPADAKSSASSLSDRHLGTSKSELVAQKRHSKSVIATLTSRPMRWIIAPRHRDCSTVPWEETCRHAREMLAAHRWLYRRAAARISELYPAFPPHHALWMCIHGDPAYGSHYGNEASTWDNPNTGGNGHYGGLQMHPGWGYGTSYYASNDSQLVQEQSAERGYAASGYSQAWLLGQWNHRECLRYA